MSRIRIKSRLFDLCFSFGQKEIDIKQACRKFMEYLLYSPNKIMYLQNLRLKMMDQEIIGDTNLLLLTAQEFNLPLDLERNTIDLMKRI